MKTSTRRKRRRPAGKMSSWRPRRRKRIPRALSKGSSRPSGRHRLIQKDTAVNQAEENTAGGDEARVEESHELSDPAAAAEAEAAAAAMLAEQARLEAQRQTELREAYESGFREGHFEGGEGVVTRMLPHEMILPGIRMEDLVQLGISHLPPGSMLPLVTPQEVAAEFGAALAEARPYSVVRLGDGELLTLAHETIISTEEARRRGPFLPYSGVELPAPDVRDALVASLRKADMIGVPRSRHPSFQGLLFPVFNHYGLDISSLRLTSSTINYELQDHGLLLPLLRGRKVLVAGDRAAGLAGVLSREGIEISGIVAPVRGVHDAEAAVIAASQYTFDVALVAAGIAAVLICTEIAERLGKPALDFGHLANRMENGC